MVLGRLGQGPLVGERAEPAEDLAVQLAAATASTGVTGGRGLIASVEGTPLLALLTLHRGAVLLLRVGAPLALLADEGRRHGAVLAGGRLAVLADIVLALAANLARRLGAALAVLLKLRATVAALDDHHLETARLAEHQIGRQIVKCVSCVAACAGVQRLILNTEGVC